MNSLDLIRLAFKNFMRRKIRTFLTILGVIIGTASIVVMLSLGIGMNVSFMKDISRMGSLNVITVDPYYYNEKGGSKQTILDDKGIERIRRIEDVEAVMPTLQSSLKFASGKYVTYGNVIGVDPAVMEKFDFKLDKGRLLQAEDTAVVIFGSSIPMNFYNPKSLNGGGFYGGPVYGEDGSMPEPVVDVMNDKMVMTFDMNYGERNPDAGGSGNYKKPKVYKVKVVGLLVQMQNEKDYNIYINLSYLKKLIKENNRLQGGSKPTGIQNQGYNQAFVKVGSINDVEKVQKQINELGYGAYSLADILKQMKKTAATMQAVLGGIGAISLLVAALGITNTMIMSIFERTREIGIMKVLGCLLGDIRKLFLMEAGMIGFMGGVVGILFSLGASFVLNKVAGGLFNGGMPSPDGEPNKISVIPLWLGLSSIGFATLVGLISGFYPARRAMKLSALEAIRTE